MSNDIIDDLGENVSGALAYSLGFVTGIVFYVLAERNRFVRFHAVQSVVVFGGIIVVAFVINAVLTVFLLVPALGPILATVVALVSQLLGLFALGLWVLLMIKAYRGERFELPVVGPLASDYAREG